MVKSDTKWTKSDTKWTKSNKKCVVYYTSWNVQAGADFSLLSEHVTHINLSFGKIARDGGKFKIIASDNMFKYGYEDMGDPYWLEPQYLKWTQLKHERPNLKMLLAFGGATYGDMWRHLDDANNIPKIADAIVELSKVKFPVFKKSASTNQYTKVGEVKLDGVDFDYEQPQRPSENQMNNLAALFCVIKKKLGKSFIVTLTGYHVSADPVSCQFGGSEAEGCSYVGSRHSGELIHLFEKMKDATNVDVYNLMAYDAGKNYPWDVAMDNHAKYIPAEKLTLGLSIGSQWSEDGSFIESDEEIIKRVTSTEMQRYGGIMIWAISPSGVTGTSTDFINKVNKIVNTYVDGEMISGETSSGGTSSDTETGSGSDDVTPAPEPEPETETPSNLEDYKECFK